MKNNTGIMVAAGAALLCGCSSMKTQFTGTSDEIVRRKMDGIKTAVEVYEEKTHTYPSDLSLLVTGPQGYSGKWDALVHPQDLVDPWGDKYQIILMSDSKAMLSGNHFQIKSCGPDHKPDTKDDIVYPAPACLPDTYEMINEKTPDAK